MNTSIMNFLTILLTELKVLVPNEIGRHAFCLSDENVLQLQVKSGDLFVPIVFEASDFDIDPSKLAQDIAADVLKSIRNFNQETDKK